ncbi:MAG: type II toxin-antitoxin system RelE/ParE family toxin [Pirellulales bacterium]|nr:type II toxin-antitoxin system RelE/ParE family toxin [Pirellulales bacterium]
MTYRLVLSHRALADIESSAHWWSEHHSPTEASRWFDGIFAAMDSLKQDPQRHGLAREADRFPYELRQRLFGVGRRKTHRILFTVRDEEIVVLSVRHAAQADVTPGDVA